MTIRTAAVDDASRIAELTAELGYSASGGDIAERLRGLSGAAGDVVLVAETGGEIAGWIQAHVSVTLESGWRMELVGLVVSDRIRRQGVGRMLVEAAEAWGRTRGVSVVCVRSNLKRIESHGFYPALGYEKAKTQAVYRKPL
jgi:predicted N-acetyltransferase YhbS